MSKQQLDYYWQLYYTDEKLRNQPLGTFSSKERAVKAMHVWWKRNMKEIGEDTPHQFTFSKHRLNQIGEEPLEFKPEADDMKKYKINLEIPKDKIESLGGFDTEEADEFIRNEFLHALEEETNLKQHISYKLLKEKEKTFFCKGFILVGYNKYPRIDNLEIRDIYPNINTKPKKTE